MFTFNEGSTETDDLSSATLTNAPDAPLPNHFIICSSHKQQQIDTSNTRTIYVLYKDSSYSKHWLSVGFQLMNQGLDMKLYLLSVNTNYWYLLSPLRLEAFVSWIHVCVEVDAINGILRGSVNGGNVTTVNSVQGLTPVPIRLYLRLGVVHDSNSEKPTQFLGSLSNMKILTKQRNNEDLLQLASGKECTENSQYLCWSTSKWNVVGKGVKEEELHLNIVCSESKTINFRLPMLWNKKEAIEECKKLGQNGTISKVSSPELVNITNNDLENIYGTHGKYFEECKYFWTPYNDVVTEGTFVDENTNEVIRYVIFDSTLYCQSFPKIQWDTVASRATGWWKVAKPCRITTIETNFQRSFTGYPCVCLV